MMIFEKFLKRKTINTYTETTLLKKATNIFLCVCGKQNFQTFFFSL